jgi:hypothetical protein
MYNKTSNFSLTFNLNGRYNINAAEISDTDSDEYLYGLDSNTSTHQIATDPFIPLYIYITVSVANVILFLTGCFGNSLVLLVVARKQDMRTPTNYFISSLAVADLLVLLICQPAALMEFFAKDRWLIGKTLCKLKLFLLQTIMYRVFPGNNV